MIPTMFQELINKLIKATEQKKISWGKTSRDTEYKVVLGSSMVTTDNWIADDGETCVDIAIWNSNGDQISTLSFTDSDSSQEDYMKLLDLYNAAKNDYLKVDETISEIMRHLE